MRFTIITPSFRQLDWLKLCIASVRDQVVPTSEVRRVTSDEGKDQMASTLWIEHIVQDAGTPGIEQFAREQEATFYRDGKEVFSSQSSVGSDSKAGYSLTIYSEKDAGMYDAVNKGLLKGTGDICAYLNCDEQYLPGALRWVGRFFSDYPSVEVLFGDVITISPNGEALCHRRASLPHPWHVMVSVLPIFTAATFFRSKIVRRGLLFPEGWRDLGDAVWAIELQRRGISCRVGRRFLSTFTYTGENMNLQPNARAERKRLSNSAPWLVKVFARPIVWTHRVRKWLQGAYRREDLSYEIWRDTAEGQRTRFFSKGLGWTWPGSTKSR
jgi:glycosyltransferase involved in cell wall biosynthesis